MLGLPWDKAEDTISISFPRKTVATTKLEILRFLVSIYDPTRREAHLQRGVVRSKVALG
jgi:hypothetical protein